MRPLGLTTYQPDKAFRGYTLFAPMRDTSAYLIDMQGAIVHRWQLPYRPGDYGYLLDNGHLLISGQTGKGPVAFGGRGGTVMEMDWDGHILWEYAEDTLHHDFCRMPNGHTMVLGWERIPAELARRVKGGTPGTEYEGGIWCDYFHEVTPDKKVVWEWHAYQHLDPDADAICPLDRRQEWTHANTCEVLPDGNVLTSFRLLNTVAIIDKQSGDFRWKWGRNELGHQHDPNPLAEWKHPHLRQWLPYRAARAWHTVAHHRGGSKNEHHRLEIRGAAAVGVFQLLYQRRAAAAQWQHAHL